MEFEAYHVHSHFSNSLTQPDSTMFISDYAKTYRERGHHVLCLSEHGNRSNVWEQFDICEAYKNDKENPYNMTPLAAAECYFVPDRKALIDGKLDGRNFHLILVAKNMNGFYELNEILSEANLSGYYYRARVDFDLLGRLNSRNFICTTACAFGIFKDENFEKYACQLAEIFGDNFYLEVQHHPQQIQVETNMKVLRMYQKYKWPLIYGTDSHYINKEDKILRKELLVASNITYGDEDSFDLHLPTAEEAYQLLWNQGVLTKAKIEEAIENTLIFREFEGVKFDKERKFPISRPELTQEQRNELYRKMVYDGYKSQAGEPTPEEKKELDAEINTIVETNSADYFIGLHDMLELGQKKGGVLTTTSRGSACGFASNYALGFTSINRLHVPVKMYPARFISRAKLMSGSMPDIDSNLSNVGAFEEAGKEIFGEWGCLPMIAYSKTQTSSAFKLLARARDLSFDIANEVSKEIQSYEIDVKHAKENNEDDPDYDVDNYVKIESYVDEKYLDLIHDSKKYKGIITSLVPHPCGHIVLHKDLRREIGLIRVKSKTGNKDAVYAAYIDGNTADKFGFCKSDLLRVDVVKIISDTFNLIGRPVMSAEELVETTKDDPKVWNILANGFTMGCNQTEREKTTQRVMTFKPKNTIELCAIIAGIRPGAKSLVDYLVNRDEHTYGIPAMDELLRLDGATGVTGKSSFLLFDEQIMRLAEAAGIAPEDTNALIKHIKKKHHNEVLAYEEKFVPGFIKYLIEKENVSEEKAKQTAKDVFTVIRNSASYLFNLSHAYAYSLDCLYGMYLKAYYPYEFYMTLLKLYDDKKNTDKISAIIAEMKRYKDIKLLSGRWGQDNTTWTADKENGTISQSISSIKNLSKAAAKDLYKLSQQEEAYMGSEFTTDTFTPEAKKELTKLKKKLKPLQEKAKQYLEDGGDEFDDEFLEMYDEGYSFEQRIKQIESNKSSYLCFGGEQKYFAKMDCFTNVLRAIQMNTCLNKTHIEILIGLNYFERFGKTGKLMKVYEYFSNSKDKLTKQIKSFNARLESCRQYENSLEDVDLPAGLRLKCEMDNIGLCLYTDASAPSNSYYVTSIDDKYTTKLTLYSIRRGTTGIMKVAKKYYHAVSEGSCILTNSFKRSQKYTYNKGVKTPVPGESEFWLTDYTVLQKGQYNIT